MVRQLEHWVGELGIPRVKIKIGESWGGRPERDLARIATARKTIGPDTELYVDANGGYTRKQAVRMAAAWAEHDVRWFEEPVSSDDLAGLAQIRDRVSADVAAGEYGYDIAYFERMATGGGLPAGRRHPLRRHHRVAARRRRGRGARPAGLRALRAQPARAPGRRGSQPAAPGVLPRPRADRAACSSTARSRRTGGTLHPDQGRPGIGLVLDHSAADPYRRR